MTSVVSVPTGKCGRGRRCHLRQERRGATSWPVSWTEFVPSFEQRAGAHNCPWSAVPAAAHPHWLCLPDPAATEHVVRPRTVSWLGSAWKTALDACVTAHRCGYVAPHERNGQTGR